MEYSGDYIIYLRKSRADMEAEQRGEGETLSRHERTLLDLAGKMKLNIVDIYREIVSGDTIAARPMMQKLLAEVGEGRWAGVLVMEVERLARGDTMDQGLVAQTFKFSGAKIITPVKTYDPENEFDEEYFEFGLFMSRREYKTINRRLQRGRYMTAKEGKFGGSIPPFGYDRVKIPHDKGYMLVPNQTEAPLVRMIFELYTKGEELSNGSYERIGCLRLARKLNELGIKTRRGYEWKTTTVRQLLLNPVYIGKIVWRRNPQERQLDNGVIVKKRVGIVDDYESFNGLHEPLVDQRTFDLAAQYLRDSVKIPRPTGTEVRNPLSGIVVCGKCGKTMQRKKTYKKNRHICLHCQTLGCDNVSSSLELVESRIIEALREWLENYTLNFEAQEQKNSVSIEALEQAITATESRMESLEKQRGKLYDLLESGVYDTNTFIERSKALAERLSETSSAAKRLTAELEEERRKELNRETLIPKARYLLEVYYDLPTAADKNAMLKEVIDKVVYTKERIPHRVVKDGFTIDLYPKLPPPPRTADGG